MLSQEISQLSVSDKDQGTASLEGQKPPNGRGKLSAKNVPARDITKDFSRAAQALPVGRLVQDEHFSLFEAVSAVEIMDPKMDSGLGGEGSPEDDYDVMRDLSVQELLGIMDQLFCFEMAWHRGFALYQSLFSSLYIDRLLSPEPDTLEDATFDRSNGETRGNELLHVVLRAFCLALIKTCDSVYRLISRERIYEEEDFVSNLYHRDLLSKFSTDSIKEVLQDAMALIQGGSIIQAEEQRSAVITRLSIRQKLLDATELEDFKDKARSSEWSKCLQLIDPMNTTHECAIAVPGAYSIKVQRRLATTMPPRPIVEIGCTEACETLKSLCSRNIDVYKILDFKSCSDALIFVQLFQTQIPQPLPYTRCLLQSMIWNEQKALGSMSYREFIFRDLGERVLPMSTFISLENDKIEAPQHPRFQIAKNMDQFARRSADAFLEIFTILCMNRCRFRRSLHHLLWEWENIELEAEETDAKIQQWVDYEDKPSNDKKQNEDYSSLFPLSMWARLHKLQLMEWIVQMGFELNVYQADEFACMYWYLKYLSSANGSSLGLVRQYTLLRLNQTPQRATQKRQNLQHGIEAQEDAMYKAAAMHEFAEGLSMLFSFLSHAELLPPTYHHQPYGRPELRYYRRMKPFAPISEPECPPFDRMMALVSIKPSPDTTSDVAGVLAAKPHEQGLGILQVAGSYLQEAKKKWDAISKWPAAEANCRMCEDWWRTDARKILKACIAANVTVAMAKNLLSKADTSRKISDLVRVELPESEESHHAWWIVPKLVPVLEKGS